LGFSVLVVVGIRYSAEDDSVYCLADDGIFAVADGFDKSGDSDDVDHEAEVDNLIAAISPYYNTTTYATTNSENTKKITTTTNSENNKKIITANTEKPKKNDLIEKTKAC
jgi:hypothetical protein